MNPKYYSKIPEVSSVVRYHQFPGPIEQTIAAHSWGVAWLITEFHPGPSVALIRAALEHDLPEHLTGDLSYLAKKKYPLLKSGMDVADEDAAKEMGISSVANLSEDDEWWLKWADLMEGALWCRHLFENFGFRPYGQRWSAYCDALRGHCASRENRDRMGPDAWALFLHVQQSAVEKLK